MSKYLCKQHCEVCNHLFKKDLHGVIAGGTFLCNSCYYALRDAEY